MRSANRGSRQAPQTPSLWVLRSARCHGPLVSVGLLCVLAGCGGATNSATDPQTSPTAAEAQPAEPSASSSVSDPTFELNFSAETAQVGAPSVAKIELQSKAPFKCNDKYPYKFKPALEPGVSYPSEVIRGDAVSVSHERVVVSVPFTASSAGAHTLRGTFSFSVCTDDQCRIEKRDLSVVVQAR